MRACLPDVGMVYRKAQDLPEGRMRRKRPGMSATSRSRPWWADWSICLMLNICYSLIPQLLRNDSLGNSKEGAKCAPNYDHLSLSERMLCKRERKSVG